MNIQPLSDRILVQRLEEETETIGGILIPDVGREKQNRGKVLAVGPGRKSEQGDVRPVDVQVGEVVMFGQYAGSEIEEGLVMIREPDVLGVLNEES